MLEVLRRSSLPVREVVPFATKRSEGRELPLGRRAGARHERRDDRGLRPRAVQRRRLDVARVGAAVRAGRRGRRRQLERVADARRRPARRQRGQPGGARRAPGDRRQPELHDDGRDAAAQGAARRVRPDVARGDLLPGRRRRGAEGDRRAGRAGRDRRPRPRPAHQRRQPRADERRARGARRHARLQRRPDARHASARAATPTRSSSSRTSRARSSPSPTSRSRRPACACR